MKHNVLEKLLGQLPQVPHAVAALQIRGGQKREEPSHRHATQSGAD